MAEIIDNFKSNRGRPNLYPWSEWSDGQSRRLTQGIDFFSSLPSMRTQIHRRAKQLGLRAHVRPEPENNALLVYFYDPNHSDSASA